MDTSKEYAEMSGEAEEIQKLRRSMEPGLLNFIRWGDQLQNVWLPYQDQLQKMIFDPIKDINASGLVERFNDVLTDWAEFGYNENTDDALLNWSMEQLWLAFVMQNNYRKTWNSTVKKWEVTEG